MVAIRATTGRFSGTTIGRAVIDLTVSDGGGMMRFPSSPGDGCAVRGAHGGRSAIMTIIGR